MKRVMALFLLLAGVLFSGCSSSTARLLNGLRSQAADGELVFGWYGSITGIDAPKAATGLNLEVEIDSEQYFMMLKGIRNDDITMFFFASIYDNADLVSLCRSMTDGGGSINVVFYNGTGDYGSTRFKHTILNTDAKKYLAKNYTGTQIIENKIKADCVVSNSICPNQVDLITKWVHISYGNKEVTYSYEILSKALGNNPRKVLEINIKSAFPYIYRNNVYFGYFVDAIVSIGGTIRYTYSDPSLDKPIDILLTSEELKKML